MDRSFELLSQDEPDADLAALAAQLGRFLFFGGQSELGRQRIEAALEMAESLALPEMFSQALNTKADHPQQRRPTPGRPCPPSICARTALEHDKPSAGAARVLQPRRQLGQFDRYAEAVDAVRDGLAQSRRVGSRYWELSFLGQVYSFIAAGEWDEAIAMTAELPVDEWEQVRAAFSGAPFVQATIGVHRGTVDEARRFVDRFRAWGRLPTCRSSRPISAPRPASSRRGRRPAGARDRGARVRRSTRLGFAAETVKEAFVVAGEAALELGDRAKLEELLAGVEALPLGRRTRFLRAHTSRFRARLAGSDDLAVGRARIRRGGRALP